MVDRWRSWFFRPATPPVTRICQLHQDLLLFAFESDEEVLSKRFCPRKPSWRDRLQRLLAEGEIKEPIKPPTSPRKQKIEAAAVSFRDQLIKMALSDDTSESIEEPSGAAPQISWEDLESALVSAIQEIGRLLVDSQAFQRTSVGLRSDPVFEYFCEAAMLPLLIDLARAKPNQSSSQTFHSVVWAPGVKSQVIQTVSLLVSSLRDKSALYFILSQNAMNQLVSCMLPLRQWTDSAIVLLLNPYVDLLKQLVLQLTASPHLFPCFIDSSNNVLLLTALLETTNFAYKQSDSFLHALCLNLIVSLLRLDPFHQWVKQSSLSASGSSSLCNGDEKKEDATEASTPVPKRTRESLKNTFRYQPQACLASHVTLLFVDRFERIVSLTAGPVVNTERSHEIAAQLGNWNNQIDLLNDVFACQVPLWNVRLCETLLQGLVSRLLLSLSGNKGFRVLFRSGGDVGVVDADVIPEPEARAQVATLCLSRLMGCLEYPPLVRMLAVALFHPCSTDLWKSLESTSLSASIWSFYTDAYDLTPVLNEIVQRDSSATEKNVAGKNPFQLELLRALGGHYGEYRFIPTAMLMEASLSALDQETLQALHVNGPMEDALKTFLGRRHQLKSVLSGVAVQSAGSLAVQMWRLATSSESIKSDRGIGRTLKDTRNYFFGRILESQQIPGVADLFVELVEDAANSLYKPTVLPVFGAGGPLVRAFVLCRHTCRSYSNHEALVRKSRGANRNDVEATRFYAEMSIFYRACCRLIDRYDSKLQSFGRPSTPTDHPQFDPVDMACELDDTFPSLRESPSLGTELDLRGRTVFRFSPVRVAPVASNPPTRPRTFSEDLMMHCQSNLAIALDPTEMFVVQVKSLARGHLVCGTVICCIPLLNVIAGATDHEWLHVAVHQEDVGYLIKNGNMALRFESAAISLLVKQYLDRSRHSLRQEINQHIELLFTADKAEDSSLSEEAETQDSIFTSERPGASTCEAASSTTNSRCQIGPQVLARSVTC